MNTEQWAAINDLAKRVGRKWTWVQDEAFSCIDGSVSQDPVVQRCLAQWLEKLRDNWQERRLIS